MGLHRMLNPELVLCSSCRSQDGNASRWSAYADERDGSVLVREVCAAQSCPELQVRGHFCVNHVLQYELSWQHFLPLRACSFCRTDVLQLYSAKQDVWFICPANESTTQAFGAEKKLTQLTPKSLARSRAEQRKKRRARNPRRSARKTQSHKLKERLVALDWSLGNIPIKPQFLWKENKRRLDAESNPAKTEANGEGSAATESSEKKSAAVYPDPTSVFCSVDGCKHFAKTGDRCRFHSPQSTFLQALHNRMAADANQAQAHDSGPESGTHIGLQQAKGGANASSDRRRMSFDAAADDSTASAGVVPRRARFSGSDDLRLLQCVRLYQPYAAEHGRKIRMWEKIAQEIRLSTEKMSLAQLTGRAVSDRFQLLLKLHRSGNLRVKSPVATAAELNQIINGMLREISNRIEDTRTARGKHMSSFAQGSSPDSMGLHSTPPDIAISDLQVDEEERVEEGGDEATDNLAILTRLSTKEQLRDEDETASAEDADAAILLHDQADQPSQEQHRQQILTSQLIAVKREKLRLKKRKLDMLAQQHEEHMALLRQRLVLEERRFHEESVSRRQEWQSLLDKLAAQSQHTRDASSPQDTPSSTI